MSFLATGLLDLLWVGLWLVTFRLPREHTWLRPCWPLRRLTVDLILLWFFVQLSWPAMAVDRCPPGVKTLSKNQSEGQVSWSSYPVQARIEDTNWGYYRKVVLHEPQR